MAGVCYKHKYTTKDKQSSIDQTQHVCGVLHSIGSSELGEGDTDYLLFKNKETEQHG